MNGGKLRWAYLALGCLATIISLTSSAPLTFAQGCDDPGVCPPAVWGQNPTVNELKPTFDAASRGQLGTSAPPLPNMYVGSSSTTTSPYVVPAVLLKAIAQVEHKPVGWKQFAADYGQYGYTIIGSDCDIGLMQITKVTADDDSLINKYNLASSWYYNFGAGARVLASKWNALALSQGGYPGGPYTVGARNPAIVEDWYYAVWAYNGFSERNNPADDDEVSPNRPMPPHPDYYDDYTYPYQEMVWGYAIYPPSDGSTPRWDAVQLTLPDRSWFRDDQMPPNNLPRPMPAHADPHGSTDIPVLGNYCCSRITVQNVSNQYAAVNVTTYSTSGTPVRYEDRTLAPLASWTIDPWMLQYGYSSYTPPSAVVAASQDVAMVARNGGMTVVGTEVPWYYTYTGFGPATSPAPDPGYGRVRSSLWVPGVYKSNYDRNSVLHIQNAGFSTAFVIVEFYDRGGALQDTDPSYGTYAIWPYGSLTLDQSADGELGAWFDGSTHIFSTNNQPLAVIVRLKSPDTYDEATSAGFGANVTLNGANFEYLHYPALQDDDWGVSSVARVQNHSYGQDIEAQHRESGDCLHIHFSTHYVGYRQISDHEFDNAPGSLYAALFRPYYTASLVGVAKGGDLIDNLFTYEAVPTQSATLLSYGPFAEASYPVQDTQVFVHNTDVFKNAKVKLYALNPNGGVVQTVIEWICPKHTETFKLMYWTQLSGGFEGSIKVESQYWGVSPISKILTALEINSVPFGNDGPIAAYTGFNR